MKTLIGSILLLCSFSLANAQIAFEKGYYFDNSGKKIDCFIKQWYGKSNPNSFVLSSQQDGSEPVTKNIEEVKEFGIYGSESYKRFTVKIDRATDDGRALGKNRVPIFKDETLFLKILVLGNAKLYGYTDVNLRRFFYETPTNPIEELVYLRYFTDDLQMGTNNYFHEQLRRNVAVGGVSAKTPKNLKYQENALVKYFLTANGSNDAMAVTQNPETQISDLNGHTKSNEKKSLVGMFALRLMPGLANAAMSLDFPAANFYRESHADIGSKIIFKIGAEFEVLPFKSKSFSVFINPAYQRFEGETDYTINKQFYNAPETDHVKISYSSVEIALGLRYGWFLNKTTKIFIDAALSADASSNVKVDDIRYNSKTGSVVSGGIGVAYKKLSLEARFSNKKTIIENLATFQSASVLLGYNFL